MPILATRRRAQAITSRIFGPAQETDPTKKVKLAMAGKLVADYVHIDQTLCLVQAA